MIAHIYDEIQGETEGKIDVLPKSDFELKDKARSKESTGERAIAYFIKERRESPSVNEMLIHLARGLGAEL